MKNILDLVIKKRNADLREVVLFWVVVKVQAENRFNIVCIKLRTPNIDGKYSKEHIK